MQKTKRIVIIGGGPVGNFAAYMLQSQGYATKVLESSTHPSLGAAAAANINHSDGFEYHKEGHQKTGEYCIDGAITKALFVYKMLGDPDYHPKRLDTGVCTVENPIRFMVSNDSLGKDGLTEESFYNNAEHMRRHFKKRFEHLSRNSPHGALQAEKILGRNSETFARRLEPQDYADCANIACGYAGSGTGFNHQDILLTREINKLSSGTPWADTFYGIEVDSIEKQKDRSYLVVTSKGKKFPADHVIITAGHSVPKLCEKIKNAEFHRKDKPKSASGTYYLNAMTYVSLPYINNKALLEKVTHINFTLQGEGGAMFACIRPPKDGAPGRGAIYYPSEKGSQLKKHIYDASNPVRVPAEWDEHIKNGLPPEHPIVKAIMQQAYKYYPFLKNYAVPEEVLCRVVFNAGNKENNLGLDRRERDIIDADIITADGHVAAFRSPKWTNAELVGLIAVDQARQSLGDTPLPKNEQQGYGPTKLDVEKIFPRLQHSKVRQWVSAIGDELGLHPSWIR